MKNHILALFGVILYVFSSCEGPVGPEGPEGLPGLDGQDGIGIPGRVFEIIGNFTADNNYTLGFNNYEIEAESDVALVYILWDIEADDDGNEFDIWRLLPQTVFLEQGALQYNYDHTYFDVNVFLDGAIDFSTLGPEWTQEQIFRVVIVPADFADSNARMDSEYNSYDKVIERYDVDDSDVKRYRVN